MGSFDWTPTCERKSNQFWVNLDRDEIFTFDRKQSPQTNYAYFQSYSEFILTASKLNCSLKLISADQATSSKYPGPAGDVTLRVWVIIAGPDLCWLLRLVLTTGLITGQWDIRQGWNILPEILSDIAPSESKLVALGADAVNTQFVWVP